MAYQDALVILAQLLQLPDAATAKANIIAIAQAADPPVDVSSIALGDPTERWIEIAAQAMDAWGSVPTQMGRGMFLQLATDPGDVADDGVADASPDPTPRPGFLSALGAGWYGTVRGESLFATTTVSFTNHSGGTITAPAGTLIFERNYTNSDGGSPTYQNTSLVTVNDGATVPVPVQADQIGTYGSATASSIVIVVTQTYGSTNTVTNPSGCNGQDREQRGDYIARCLEAPDSNAPGGPVAAYKRAATTGKSGSPLLNYSTGLPVSILGAWVSASSATGRVMGYFYGPSGPVSNVTDVSTANANIIGMAIGGLTDPLGVLPDTASIGPAVSDPATGPGFADSTATPIAVTYSAKIKASKVPGGASPGTYTSGGSPPQAIANLFAGIAQALNTYLPGLGPGGADADPVTGGGFVYTPDLQDVTQAAVSGLYNVVLSLPSTGSTTINVGHVPTQGTTLGTIVVVAG